MSRRNRVRTPRPTPTSGLASDHDHLGRRPRDAVKRTTVRAVNRTPDAPFDPSADVDGEVFDGMAEAPAFDEEASESDLQ